MNTGKIVVIITLLLASLLTGCMQGVSFSRSVYPPEASKQEAPPPFMALVSITTGWGKSFVERAPKTFRIELYKASVLKTAQKFSLTAGSLDMVTSWRTAGEPVVRFYEYPPVDFRTMDFKDYKALRRLILTKHFHYNAATDVFDEVSGPAPTAVKSE